MKIIKYPELEEKVVIVTGGSSGIGRSAAIAFAGTGAKVVVAARSTEGCESTCNTIFKNGGEAISILTDVTHVEQIEALVKATVKEYGRLDFAFNNAGMNLAPKQMIDVSEDEWDLILATNLKSVWAMMKYEIPEMLKQEKAAIVNTSSVSGSKATPLSAAYAASKAGVNSLTASVAKEVAIHGIRVNAINPGFIETPMTADLDPEIKDRIHAAICMGRAGQPEDISALAIWLCSDQAAYLTGQSIVVDGGYTT